MCGIAAMMNMENRDVVPAVLKILKNNESRGYDSAGVSAMNGELQTRKSKGKVSVLSHLVSKSPIHGSVVIGHTRWATHGDPSDTNAHPHVSNNGHVSVVHNGTIENFEDIKRMLVASGFYFHSETDTEVVPNLIELEMRRNIESPEGLSQFANAVARATTHFRGAYALAIVHAHYPDELIVVRHMSPVIIGFDHELLPDGKKGRLKNVLAASNMTSLAGMADEVMTLANNQMVAFYKDGGYEIVGINGKAAVEHKAEKLNIPASVHELGHYDTFMRKEIAEQPQALREALRGRVDASGAIRLGAFQDEQVRAKMRTAPRFVVVACGTSYNSALVFKYTLERLAGVPVEVQYASEYVYSKPAMIPGEVVIGISQSGETADTLQALKNAKERGAFLYSITNTVSSSMANMVDVGTFLHVGPEIAVASTKAFTGQCVVLLELALRIAELRGVGDAQYRRALGKQLLNIPDVVAHTLATMKGVEDLAQVIKSAKRCFFIGRDVGYPLALEGALKLKEVAYISAEGHAAGELKHGHIALIEDGVPVIAMLLNDGLHEKVLNSVHEVQARKGMPIIINAGHEDLVKDQRKHRIIQLPCVAPELAPIIAVLPLQLLALHTGLALNYDVDMPRNLAKSVTVE